MFSGHLFKISWSYDLKPRRLEQTDRQRDNQTDRQTMWFTYKDWYIKCIAQTNSWHYLLMCKNIPFCVFISFLKGDNKVNSLHKNALPRGVLYQYKFLGYMSNLWYKGQFVFHFLTRLAGFYPLTQNTINLLNDIRSHKD